jgi:hypothetical protein
MAGIRTSAHAPSSSTRAPRAVVGDAPARGRVVESAADEAPRGPRDVFERSGLKPFGEYYKEARATPKMPPGQPTVDTFDLKQIEALHRAYWSAPATASLSDMIALAKKDPAFKSRKDVDDRQVGRLFAKMPDCFPWGWRSRTLAMTSHVLVDALVKTPQGTPLGQVIDALRQKDKEFPDYGAFKKAATSAWVEEPARFPFAKVLNKTDNGYALVPIGASTTSSAVTMEKGRLRLTAELAKEVAKLAEHPSVRFPLCQ